MCHTTGSRNEVVWSAVDPQGDRRADTFNSLGVLSVAVALVFSTLGCRIRHQFPHGDRYQRARSAATLVALYPSGARTSSMLIVLCVAAAILITVVVALLVRRSRKRV